MVKSGQVKIGEYLARKISDGKTALGVRMKKAFTGRKPMPIFAFTFNDTPLCRIIENYLMTEINHQVFIQRHKWLADSLNCIKIQIKAWAGIRAGLMMLCSKSRTALINFFSQRARRAQRIWF
jgi:hypothetical protein